MITRRDFVATSAATIAAGAAQAVRQAGVPERGALPLRAAPKVRWLHATILADGHLRLTSDGPTEPRPLIRPEVLDAAFGAGTRDVLVQPDHWAMIEAGWFSGADLVQPTDPASKDYETWCAFHRPEVEAHDLLMDLFGVQAFWLFGGRIADLGLTFQRHPTTPRFATVTVEDRPALSRLTDVVLSRTDWIRIEPTIRTGSGGA